MIKFIAGAAAGVMLGGGIAACGGKSVDCDNLTLPDDLELIRECPPSPPAPVAWTDGYWQMDADCLPTEIPAKPWKVDLFAAMRACEEDS